MRTLRQGIPAFRPRAAATVLLQILPSESRLSSEKNRPAQDWNSKPPVKVVETKQKPEQDLDQRSFERMMDGSMLDMLRANRDRLQKAMDDTSTPANALPAISRQLIDVCERIESLQGGGLTDLLDDEEDEVTDDVGASIV